MVVRDIPERSTVSLYLRAKTLDTLKRISTSPWHLVAIMRPVNLSDRSVSQPEDGAATRRLCGQEPTLPTEGALLVLCGTAP